MTVTSMPTAAIYDWPPDWDLLGKVGIAFVVVLWLATAFWTFKDARRRIADHRLVALATLLGSACRSSGRSSTCSSAPPSTCRTSTSASSRSRRWSSGWRSSTSAAPCVGPGSRLRISCARVHDATEGRVRDLRSAARRALAGVPALRDPVRTFSRPSRTSHACLERASAGSCPNRWPEKRHWFSSSPTVWSDALPARSSRDSSDAGSSSRVRGCSTFRRRWAASTIRSTPGSPSSRGSSTSSAPVRSSRSP